jgi:hypothetical protein
MDVAPPLIYSYFALVLNSYVSSRISLDRLETAGPTAINCSHAIVSPLREQATSLIYILLSYAVFSKPWPLYDRFLIFSVMSFVYIYFLPALVNHSLHGDCDTLRWKFTGVSE